MNAKADPGRSGSDDDGEIVRRVLTRYVEGHSPEMERIEARLAESQRAWMLEPEPLRADRSPLPSPRVGAGLLAVAAVVLAVLVASGAGRGSADNTVAGQPDGTVVGLPTAPPSVLPSTTAATPEAGPGPLATDGDPAATVDTSSSATVVSPGPTGGTPGSATTTPAGAPASAPTTGQPPSSAAPAPSVPSTQAGLAGVSLDVSDIPDGLELSADGYLDWVVAGARSDGVIVRLNQGPGAITVAGPSPAAQRAAAPFEVTWSNGKPEQSRTGNRTWWSAPAQPAVFTVRVDASLGAAEVALYAGGTAAVQVTVTVEGLGSRQIALPSHDAGTAGIVMVALDESARGRDVLFVVGAESGTGTVALGDVTAR